ncbi:hypothetical protein SAMN04489806_2058 [Paramicrobacterium humi]|uniref:Uncharacterized protein n=1 Tax=Paramicrobacterium humi TaxID=640635 RepID=A0A1H4N1Y9_9MICO|nr:hypothetical protein [Microbacterium humi]SEB89301.1 hypothetical protein SAMN04489806_2058 [Microbacterium humi]
MTTSVQVQSTTALGLPTADEVVLDPISEREWRVIDTRLSQQDAPSVLGFIERFGDDYEVLVIGHGFERWSFTSLRDAKAHFTQ